VFWFQLVVAVAVLGAIAWVAAGRGTPMAESYSDRPDLALPPQVPLRKADVDGVRFSIGLRGYRMDEVDAVLDRLAGEIAARDVYIDRLTAQYRQLTEQSEPLAVASGGARPEVQRGVVDQPEDSARPGDATHADDAAHADDTAHADDATHADDAGRADQPWPEPPDGGHPQEPTA
jgi:DivIVA domain-containing protein